MTNSAIQLVSLFENSPELPLEQIAESEGIELGALKAILYANSGVYRAKLKEGESDTKPNPLDLTEHDEEIANAVFRRVAQFSDDDSVALKAAMFIKNERRGRHDVKAGLRNLNFNVAVLQEHWAKAAEAIKCNASSTKQLKTVDV